MESAALCGESEVSRRKFDETGHPCNASYLDEDAWYYVQKEGLIICTHSGKPGKAVTMRWRSVKRALADHEKAKERKS